MRIYTVFPTMRGLSTRTADYAGVEYVVAAVSIKQAYYLAGSRTWCEAVGAKGLIEIYSRGSGHQMWCGCVGHAGTGLGHGDGVTKIRAAMERHLRECEA